MAVINENGESEGYGAYWTRWLDKFEEETLVDLKKDIKKGAIAVGIYGFVLVTYGVVLNAIIS